MVYLQVEKIEPSGQDSGGDKGEDPEIMAYQVGNGMWNGVFAVPNIVTDQHLKLASGLSVKVLLLLLRRAGNAEPREMAQLLGQSVSDIQDAVNYWIAQGILAEAGAPVLEYEKLPAEPQEVAQPVLPVNPAQVELTVFPAVSAAAPERPSSDEPRRVTTLSSSRPRLTTQEINELASQDKNITYLLQETQSVLGKPLTPVASSTMASLYSYTGMQPDLILMLVHYCVSIGKDNMRYIEKVADSWVEKGIDSHEKAEAEILRLTQSDQMENKIKSAFGIYDRTLVPSEKAFIQAWIKEYGQDMPLIQLAFERAVEIKGKLSFAYINGILSNWHAKGVTTTAQAMAEIKDNRPAKVKSQGKSSSYDIGELENMINYGDIV